ncbi:MAG: hypothetical protein ABIG63_00150 [Chloroflexota bacterium]
MKRILSIDWDYFFRIPPDDEDWEALYDWGGKENSLYIDGVIWLLRAASFYELGRELPGTTSEELGFWDRFRFNPGCELVVVDSHADIIQHIDSQVAEVISFDAHHDAYNPADSVISNGFVTCENWASLAVANDIKVSVRYPFWRAANPDAKPKEKGLRRQIDTPKQCLRRPFDLVFVCRSGAWTPPWLDQSFFAFIDACPVGRRKVSVLPRTIDMEEAKKMAEVTLDFYAAIKLHKQNKKLDTANHAVVPAEELRRV